MAKKSFEIQGTTFRIGSTAVSASNVTAYASETYVNTAVANLVDSAPSTLNTLNELADALGNDANFASTIATAIGNKADSVSLSTVATSGSYTDLSNKPTIPTNTNQLTNGAGFLTSVGTISYTDLSNKPTLFDGAYASLSGKPTIPTNTNQLTNGAGFLVASDISGKQATLVSGTNIRTINNNSILGSGDLGITATSLLPSQVGNSGKYLTTNGAGTLSWETVSGGSGSGPTNYFKGLQILEDVYEASGAANIIFESTDSSVTITRNANALDFTVAGSGGGTDYSALSEIAIGAGAADAFSPSAPQGSNGIAIGSYAGADAQGANSVSIGAGAGGLIQGANSIALGENAANNYQGNNSIAIGTNAGRLSQGNYAIAIGTNAGYSNQPASSICINASQFDMQPSVAGLYIKPVRSATTSNVIYYDSDTGEMTYGAAPSGSSGGGGSGGEDATAFSWNASIVGPLYTTDMPWTPPAKTGPMIAILAGETWSTIWTASSNGTTQKSPRGGSSISPPWASAWYGTVSGPQTATTQNSQNGGYGNYAAYSLDSSTNPATDEMWAGQIMADIDSSTGVVSISNVYSSINWSPMSPGYLYGYINVSASSNELAGFTGEAGMTWLLDVDYSRIRIIVPPSVWAANGGMGGPIGTITGLSPSSYYNASISGLIFGV